MQKAYKALSPGTSWNTAIPRRLANKLAYSMTNTNIKLTFVHNNNATAWNADQTMDPPLWAVWPMNNNPAQQQQPVNVFQANEIGWQDSVTVTVTHQLALLPGPSRLLFSRAASATGQVDQVSGTITQTGSSYANNPGSVYTYPLTAAATLGNEGEKPLLNYVYQP
jgi:hypothetical protein